MRGIAGSEELRLMWEASNWTQMMYEAEHALFRAENGTPGIVGSHAAYQWLTMTDLDISDLLRWCPEAVVGKYLAVTSADGAALRLTDQEKSDGWWTAEAGKVVRGHSWESEVDASWRVAYSPRLNSIHGLPNETREGCDGFNEWYIFHQAPPVCEVEVFVKWVGFRLYDPTFQWCAERLWEQMARLAPESYIAEGTVFTFITRNATLFDGLLEKLSASMEPPGNRPDLSQ